MSRTDQPITAGGSGMDNWEAECDARTLADADKITKDPKRLANAQQAAASMVSDKEAEAKAMRKVAGKAAPKGSETRGLANHYKEMD